MANGTAVRRKIGSGSDIIFDHFIFSFVLWNIFLVTNFVLYDLYLNFNISFVDQLSSQINKKEQKYRGMKCVQYKARCHASAAKKKAKATYINWHKCT